MQRMKRLHVGLGLAAFESRVLASVVPIDKEHSKWSFDWKMINQF